MGMILLVLAIVVMLITVGVTAGDATLSYSECDDNNMVIQYDSYVFKAHTLRGYFAAFIASTMDLLSYDPICANTSLCNLEETSMQTPNVIYKYGLIVLIILIQVVWFFVQSFIFAAAILLVVVITLSIGFFIGLTVLTLLVFGIFLILYCIFYSIYCILRIIHRLWEGTLARKSRGGVKMRLV